MKKVLLIVITLIFSLFIIRQYRANVLLYQATEMMMRGEAEKSWPIFLKAGGLDPTEPIIFYRLQDKERLREIAPYFTYNEKGWWR